VHAVGRKKVDIRPIPEGRKRQVTFMKRKAGLLKKAMELSILCGCEMGAYIHIPCVVPGRRNPPPTALACYAYRLLLHLL
jgi:hypothetical protein